MAALAALGALACDDAGLAEWCDRDEWALEWDDEGLPPAGAEVEWVDRGIPFERPSGGLITQYWLPWDINDRQAYPVRSGEDVHVWMRFMAGHDRSGDCVVYRSAFVDGRPVELIADGRPAREASLMLEEGLGEMHVVLPFDLFRPGMNNVHFVGRYECTLASGTLRDAEDMRELTVARETDEGGEVWEDTEGYKQGEFMPGYATTAWFEHYLGDEAPLYRWDEGFPWDGESGRVSVILRAQGHPWVDSCGEPPLMDTFVLLALLDGEVVPLGEHERIVATIPAGEQRVFRFDLDLPRDGEEHRFEIIQLGGLGRPAWLRGGRLVTPWRGDSLLITRVKWND